MSRILSLRGVALGALLLLALPAMPAASADTTPYVTLEGRAVLPADTFAPGPPSGFAITGNTSGRKAPFASQPVQGFSAVLPNWDGNWLAMADNGFGNRANSADFRLRWYSVKTDWAKGSASVAGYTELSDPQRLVPFPIVNGDLDRVLTGADFDPESFRQLPDGTFWYGEEFGPYLLHTDMAGRLLEAPIPTPYPAALAPFAKGLPFIQSPDNPAFRGIAKAEDRLKAANLPSSKGFEGMAMSKDGSKLYPLLEGALIDDPIRTRLLVQEFDTARRQYTGRYWFYPLADAANAIGDMTAINDSEFLVIERDNGQGTTATFKRIYKVNLGSFNADGTLKKALVADLMSITDDQGLTKPEAGSVGMGRSFSFPFQTIEDVYPVDERTLLVVDDNNYPFSSGRRPGLAPDDNEFILLHLPEALSLDR